MTGAFLRRPCACVLAPVSLHLPPLRLPPCALRALSGALSAMRPFALLARTVLPAFAVSASAISLGRCCILSAASPLLLGLSRAIHSVGVPLPYHCPLINPVAEPLNRCRARALHGPPGNAFARQGMRPTGDVNGKWALRTLRVGRLSLGRRVAGAHAVSLRASRA